MKIDDIKPGTLFTRTDNNQNKKYLIYSMDTDKPNAHTKFEVLLFSDEIYTISGYYFGDLLNDWYILLDTGVNDDPNNQERACETR